MTKTSNRSSAHKAAKAKTLSPSVKTEKKAGKRSTAIEKKPETRKVKNESPGRKVSSVKTLSPSVKTEKKASSSTGKDHTDTAKKKPHTRKAKKTKVDYGQVENDGPRICGWVGARFAIGEITDKSSLMETIEECDYNECFPDPQSFIRYVVKYQKEEFLTKISTSKSF
jgi:hypothetical protein